MRLFFLGGSGLKHFRPFIEETRQWPIRTKDSLGIPDANSLVGWKFLLREWYFDTHRLLNGSISFAGINDYIQVGDNVIIDGRVLNITPNIKRQNIETSQHGFLLAHVESINHNFTINPDGHRSYITSIQFVRGILVENEKTRALTGSSMRDMGKLDMNAESAKKDNSLNVVKMPSSMNPIKDGQ